MDKFSKNMEKMQLFKHKKCSLLSYIAVIFPLHFDGLDAVGSSESFSSDSACFLIILRSHFFSAADQDPHGLPPRRRKKTTI